MDHAIAEWVANATYLLKSAHVLFVFSPSLMQKQNKKNGFVLHQFAQQLLVQFATSGFSLHPRKREKKKVCHFAFIPSVILYLCALVMI